MTILQHILDDIRDLKDISSLSLTDFHLCSPFTVVLLSDGSVGSASNYDVQNCTKGYAPAQIKRKYQSHLHNIAVLLEMLRSDESLAGMSLYTAILSALSQDLLNDSTLRPHGLVYRPVFNWHSSVKHLSYESDVVSLIGYGGALDPICASGRFKHLYICDFMFEEAEYREIAWRHIKTMGWASSRITLTDGAATGRSISLSDICFITGSALCNGTMEGLLRLAQGCREVVLQGPSCSLFPAELFRRSVSMLLTTIKTRSEFELGKRAGDDIYKVVDRNYIAISKLKE